MPSQVLDLGSGHILRFTSWHPDRSLNPQYADLPDVERYGAIVEHPLRPDDEQCRWRGLCTAGITFDGEVQQHGQERELWQVQSWDPLTISPSLLCHCGDHGFIQAGKWVSA